MSKLNKDILFLIFEELQSDSKSLFSCLMVNRLWCETVIPILWRNPWCYNIDYSNKIYLFIIITSYFSDDIKEFLTRLGIQLVPSVSHKSLLFDYLSFCRSLNINTINSISSVVGSSANYQLFLQQELYGLFMKKCPELKYLDMRSIAYPIFHFPEARLCFESLYELQCDIYADNSYFYGLARICQYIQKLIIVNLHTDWDKIPYNDLGIANNLGIVKLIEVQKNLKYFEWEDLYLGCQYKVDLYKEILLALEKKADIINHLMIDFEFVDRTLQKILPKFHKLKSLMIGFNDFSEKQLKMCVFHDLEIFKIVHDNLKAASIIIENSGGHLKKVLLKPYDLTDYVDNFVEDSLILIRNIHKNCPLIEYLSITFSPSKEHIAEIEKLLKTCKNLKLLSLVIDDYSELYEEQAHEHEEILEYEEIFLKLLISLTPTNIKEIRFCGNFRSSVEALEEFFGKWKGRALSILTCDSIYKGENYIRLINKYKNNGVIKYFNCEVPMYGLLRY